MGEWSSTSSDSDSDSDFSRRRARQRRSLNDERGVIKREAWANGSGSDSSTGAESDFSDDIPLAQTEMQSDASDSDAQEGGGGDSDTTMGDKEETEDVDVRIKPEGIHESVSAHDRDEEETEDDEHKTAESDAEREEDADEEDETEDVDIRIKAETPPTENQPARDEIAESAEGDDGDQGQDGRSVDEEESVDGDESAVTLRSTPRTVRKARLSRSRARKAVEDSESEWSPGQDGDDDDDDDGETEPVVPDKEPAERAHSRHELDEEQQEDAEEDDDSEDAPEPIGRLDFDDAQRFFTQLKRGHLPTTEGSILWDGGSLSGPPIDRPLSQADQWRRKYRWPVALRNTRRRNFVADAKDLSEVYDVPLRQGASDATGPSIAAKKAFAAALAPTVRPLMETAVATSREQSRKRRREAVDGREEAMDLSWLRTVTRLGGHYTDQLLDSIFVKNVLSLQGITASYPQQCWDPLPTSKRPIANRRFVLEHFCKSSTHGVDAPVSSPCPKLRRDTLIRIRDRLRTLYGLSWRPEDDEFFNLVDRQELDPPDLVDDEILRL